MKDWLAMENYIVFSTNRCFISSLSGADQQLLFSYATIGAVS